MRRQRFFSVLIFILSIFCLASCVTSTTSSPSLPATGIPASEHYEQVAVLLPLHGSYQTEGIAVKEGFLAGYYANLNQGGKTTSIRFYDTSEKNSITKVYDKALSDGAQIIVGPLTKENVIRLAAQRTISVPTLTLNYLPPYAKSSSRLYQFGLSPQNEAIQVADKAIGDGLQRAIILAPSGDWGKNVASAFSSRFRQLKGTVVETLYYKPNEDLSPNIKNLLQVTANESGKKNKEKINPKNLRRQDFDMFFLIATPEAGSAIVPLFKFYYAGNIPVYATSLINAGNANTNTYTDLNNVKFPDIIGISSVQTTQHSANYLRLYALGQDAYHLIFNLENKAALNGETGNLYFSADNCIYQTLQWMQFRDGAAVPIK